jgi:hypothetical protein
MAKLHELEAGKRQTGGGGGHGAFVSREWARGKSAQRCGEFTAPGRVSGPPRVVGQR